MNNKNKVKNKALNVFITLVLITLIIVVIFIIIKYYNRYVNEESLRNEANTIFDEIAIYNDATADTTIDSKYKGYDVWGIIKIDKLKLCYPILDSLDDKALKISVIKFFESKNSNGYTNLTLAGHNNYDNTMFGKLKQLQNGDVIEIVDKNAKSKKYIIYNTYVTSPMDVSYTGISNDVNTNELTLVTCRNGNNKRYIVKAKEII